MYCILVYKYTITSIQVYLIELNYVIEGGHCVDGTLGSHCIWQEEEEEEEQEEQQQQEEEDGGNYAPGCCAGLHTVLQCTLHTAHCTLHTAHPEKHTPDY